MRKEYSDKVRKKIYDKLLYLGELICIRNKIEFFTTDVPVLSDVYKYNYNPNNGHSELNGKLTREIKRRYNKINIEIIDSKQTVPVNELELINNILGRLMCDSKIDETDFDEINKLYGKYYV